MATKLLLKDIDPEKNYRVKIDKVVRAGGAKYLPRMHAIVLRGDTLVEVNDQEALVSYEPV